MTWIEQLGQWIGRLVKSKPKPMVEAPQIKKLPLASNQYRQDVVRKRFIFLHHTAGGSAASAINTWASNPARIATAYVIERTGDIYECFDPKFWANSLGGDVSTQMEKETIAIEIVAFGNLTVAPGDKFDVKGRTVHKKGDLLAWTGRVIPKDEAVLFDFRGFRYYHRYTDEQITALEKLLPWLMEKFNIPWQSGRNEFWEYQKPSTLTPGVYSHTTVRKDKVDIFPQKELVNLIYKL